jgi:hypothetical protein
VSAKRRPEKTTSKKAAPARKPVRKSRVAGAELGKLLRKSGWLVVVLMAVHLLLGYMTMEPAPHTGGDNAGYLTLAKSMTERGTYQDLYDPREPAHTQYPPVFPLILAAASLIGIKTWLQLKYMTLAFSALAVGFTYLWIRGRGRPELAFGVAGLIAVAPGVLNLAHWELSDVPFWAMTMIAVYAWDRLRPGDYKTLAIAVVLTTLAYLTRSAGLPLLIAAAAWLTWRKQWKSLAIFAITILPFALWWYIRARTQGGVDYASQFSFVDPYNPALGRIGAGELLVRMKDNGAKYINVHLPILLFGAPRFIPVSVLIVLLGIYGWVCRLRRPRISELFLPLYIGLLLIWPAVWSGERFLLPALPFIVFFAGDGLVRLLRMLAPATARLVPAGLAALMVLLTIPQLSEATRISRECMALYKSGERYPCIDPISRDLYTMAEVAPRVLPANSAVLTRKPRIFYHVSGIPGQIWPLVAQPDSFFRLAAEIRARYVLFDPRDGLSQAYVAPVLVGHPNRFCLVFGIGQDRPMLFAIADHPLPAPAAGEQFATCGPEYWKSAAARDSLMQGAIQTQ